MLKHSVKGERTESVSRRSTPCGGRTVLLAAAGLVQVLVLDCGRGSCGGPEGRRAKGREGRTDSVNLGRNVNRATKNAQTPPEAVDLDHPRFPPDFRVAKVIRVPRSSLESFSQRVLGRVDAVANYLLAAKSARAHVNIIRAASDRHAAAIEARLKRQPGDPLRIVRRGRHVVEFVGMSVVLMHRFKRSMGLLDRSRRVYRFTARLGLVKDGNAGDLNDLFNLLLKPRPDDRTWSSALRRWLKVVRFGRTLRLRRYGTGTDGPKYTVQPAESARRESGDSVVFSFGNVPVVHGIPTVRLMAEVPTAGFTPLKGKPADLKRLTRATRYWPVGDPRIRELVSTIVGDKKSDSERLASVHRWVYRSIRYAGSRTGSRDGTINVLVRKYGRCWDKADVLATLARAAGLAARQVAGWVEELSAGHIWTEVFVRGQGWVSVDATVPWRGVSGGYVPLMTTEDGHMPLLYVEMPQLVRLK